MEAAASSASPAEAREKPSLAEACGIDEESKPEYDTNADILPSKRTKAPCAAEETAAKALSKRKRKKMEQLAQKRASADLRSSTLEELRKARLSAEQLDLLRASQSTYRSRRHKVAEAQRLLAAGLPIPAELQKLRKRKAKPGEEQEADEGESDDSEPAVPAPVQKTGLATEDVERRTARPEPPQAVEVRAPPSSTKPSPKAAPKPAPKPEPAAPPAPAKPQMPGLPLVRVRVERTELIEEQRSKLPAVMVEQECVEMALANDVLIVSGDTGCGKSTQVPQFLYEAGVCRGDKYMIGVTQPRRVAAISVSQRVGDELNNTGIVGYQVRYDKTHCSKDTRIKFMTDGILLREVQADFLCQKFVAIIIDEAHERGVNCDILIGLLSRAVQRRRQNYDEAVAAGRYKPGADLSKAPPPPLKLVVMSATLRLCDFTENRHLFRTPPPVMKIDARTFPVTAHFARTTEEDYIKAAKTTVFQIHKQLPPGTILVFVTGRQEVMRLCAELCRSARKPAGADAPDEEEEEEEEWDDGGLELLEASDDEGGAFDDDLDGAEGGAANEEPAVGAGKPKKAAKKAAEVAAEEAPTAAEEPATTGGRKKKRKGRAAEAPTQAAPSPAEPSAAAQAAAPRKKRKKRPAGDPEDTAAQQEGEEPEIDFRLDPEEDVVLLEAEKEGEKEDAKDAASKAAGRINMAKLDRSRTADGAFKGLGFGEGPLKVLPLFAQLNARAQLLPFAPAPEDARVVVVATNVAETSITLPNVRYVVDCGHEKRRKYKASSGVSAFAVERISKASSDQRAGRAGRIGPGHAYRMYSSAAYENHFQKFAPIAMLHTPMDPVLLLLAFLGVPRLDAFPWPTPPSPEATLAAVRRLRALGAIVDDGTNKVTTGTRLSVKCTALGFQLAALPVAPRYAKMLLAAAIASQGMEAPIIVHACAVVAALSVGNLSSWESLDDEVDPRANPMESELVRAQRDAHRTLLAAQKKEAPRWSQLRDDAEGLLWLMGGYSWTVERGEDATDEFCRANKLNPRQVAEAHNLMQQLGALLKHRLPSVQRLGLELPLKLKPPTSLQTLKLRECITDGLVDRVAVAKPELGSRAYVCADLGQEVPIFIHSSSNAFRHRPYPTVLVFNEIIATKKPFMRDVISIDPLTLSRRAAAGACPVLTLGEFLPVPAPRYLADQDEVMAFCAPSYSPLDFQLPTVELAVPSDSIFRYKVFAKALLEGEVLPGVPAPGARLLARPSMVLHAPTNPRVTAVVGVLWEARVGSKAELLRKWSSDRKFLLAGYLKWLPPALHEDISISWPPVAAPAGGRRG